MTGDDVPITYPRDTKLVPAGCECTMCGVMNLYREPVPHRPVCPINDPDWPPDPPTFDHEDDDE